MKVHKLYCRFTRGNWLGEKDGNFSNQKTDKLQKGDWNDERFDKR